MADIERIPVNSNVARIDPRQRLWAKWLESKSETTRATYRMCMEDFRRFVGSPNDEHATQMLFTSTAAQGNNIALEYQTHLLERGLAPNTVNLRLAALRSLVKLGRMIGAVDWTLTVPGVKVKPYRDVHGPGVKGFKKMLRVVDRRDDDKGRRDRALLRLLFDSAFRRAEVVELDLEHVDLEAGVVWIRGKGQKDRTRWEMADVTVHAIREWLEVRGTEPGPLFVNFDRAGKGKGTRLTPGSVTHAVKTIAAKAGLRCTPHALRHAAITTYLEATDGDVRGAKEYARHASLNTTLIYDDRRNAGERFTNAARLVAAAAG